MTHPPQEQSDLQLSPRLTKAFSLALKLHWGQTRKRADDERDGPVIPYIGHLMAVAALVLEHGGDEDEASAALLHDGPEDQGGRDTLWEIKRKFGKRVAKIVGACSDTLVGDPRGARASEFPPSPGRRRRRRPARHPWQGAVISPVATVTGRLEQHHLHHDYALPGLERLQGLANDRAQRAVGAHGVPWSG